VLGPPQLVRFVPFDPSKKISEAIATDANGQSLRIVKGAFSVVATLATPHPAMSEAADKLENQGFRVLAVASGTLRSTSKKVSQLLFLGIGLIMTGHAIVTPLLMVIVMISGDFLSRAYATDNVRPSGEPNHWDIGRITAASAILGACSLGFLSCVLAIGQFRMGLDLTHIQTFSVIAIVYGSQAMTYAVRDRRQFWAMRPLVC
jgi:hypothetical protein